MPSARHCHRRFLVETARAKRAFEAMDNMGLGRRDQETAACGLFVTVFSTFEVGIADLFMSYAMGGQALDGSTPQRFVTPRDTLHAISLAKSGQQHLFWADAGRVIERSADWFDDGYKIADALRTHKNHLDKSRKLRNYISHRSLEAWGQFQGVWTSDIGPAPRTPAHPGEFLLTRKGRATAPTMFERYVESLSIAHSTACGLAP